MLDDVMANFISQLDQAMRSPDIGPNSILGVSVRIFLGEMSICISIWMAWRRQWQPTPVLLPGKSHGWKSMVGCSP